MVSFFQPAGTGQEKVGVEVEVEVGVEVEVEVGVGVGVGVGVEVAFAFAFAFAQATRHAAIARMGRGTTRRSNREKERTDGWYVVSSQVTSTTRTSPRR